MDSSSEKLDKNDESGEPNDSVEKVHTEAVENIVQPECHPEEELKNETNIDANSSNEDIYFNDIVLITESVDNTKSIEPNITNKEDCDVQAVEQNENVNIDSIPLIEPTESEMQPEKCDDEPMDIDEILNSFNVDFDTPSSSEAQNVCEASTSIVAENLPKSPYIDREEKGEDVVLLSDDEEEVKLGKFKDYFPQK